MNFDARSETLGNQPWTWVRGPSPPDVPLDGIVNVALISFLT